MIDVLAYKRKQACSVITVANQRRISVVINTSKWVPGVPTETRSIQLRSEKQDIVSEFMSNQVERGARIDRTALTESLSIAILASMVPIAYSTTHLNF